MKASKKINSIFTAMLLICMVPTINVHAQEQGLRWSKWSEGQRVQGSGAPVDKVINSYVDSVGNTYIFGEFGKDACLSEFGENGPYICPMDSISGFVNGNTHGVYLAKIDTAGIILWCKSARGATANEPSIAWNMVVKDNSITIAFSIVGSTWLYLFDTLLTSSCEHYYKGERTTYFVTFDLDGNRVDIHDIRLYALSSPTARSLIPVWFTGHVGFSCFGIDDDHNIHIFSCSEFAKEDSLHKAYIIVDNDTNKIYQLNVNTMNGEYFSKSVYYRMDSNWELIGSPRYMIDSIAGWQPYRVGALAYLRFSNVVSDGDGVYVNGHFTCDDARLIAQTMTDTSSFSATIFLDSIHYLKVENTRDFKFMPFLIKLNKNGVIEWVQQLYTESPNDDYYNFYTTEIDGIVLDEDNVYTQYWAYDYYYFTTTQDSSLCATFYLDSAHTIPLARNHAGPHIIIVSYDKLSGAPVEYYYIDTVEKTRSESIAIVGDELILNAGFSYVSYTDYISWRKTELCQINKYTKDVKRSAPITHVSSMTDCSISINSNGWVFRASTGDGARVYDSIPVSPTSTASIMTFFYDSSLDMRPKPCSKVDSLWGSTSQHTASIHWSSTFSHTGYELAYMPDGSSWDNATTLETSAATATITLPDDQCYQFRIRGLCDGHRVATSSWSTPITLCPEVGISDVETASRITLSPNPTTGKVTIQGLVEEPLSIELFDITGRPVATFTDTTFDISHLPQGNYIVKVTSAMGNTYHLKLIKK